MSRYIDYNVDIEIDLIYFIDNYRDEELIEELESRGFVILNKNSIDSRRAPNQNLHESLCDQFGVSRYSTRQELLKHINDQL
jgi:predicted nucleotide-binding protein (sugar kinase/HSP70/actin superfamily)